MKITSRNVSLKAGVCIFCRAGSERLKVIEKPKVTFEYDKYLVPQESFSGHTWGSAEVNPLG